MLLGIAGASAAGTAGAALPVAFAGAGDCAARPAGKAMSTAVTLARIIARARAPISLCIPSPSRARCVAHRATVRQSAFARQWSRSPRARCNRRLADGCRRSEAVARDQRPVVEVLATGVADERAGTAVDVRERQRQVHVGRPLSACVVQGGDE